MVSFAHAAEKQYEVLYKKIPASEFGVNAKLKKLDKIEKLVSYPPLSKDEKGYLMPNRLGFDFTLSQEMYDNWFTRKFMEYATKLEKPILEVGPGNGTFVLRAIAKDNTVIASDVSIKQLINIRRYVTKDGLPLKNLYLDNSSFPETTNFKERSLSAVMLHRVLYFLSPNQVEEGLAKIYKWLEPEGKLFIAVMSPQHGEFSDWFLPTYEQRWKEGEDWPGNCLKTKDALPLHSYNLPEYIHVMDERPLERALYKYGFSIESKGFISMKSFSGAKGNKRNGKEVFGIIAAKRFNFNNSSN